jgi:hypothetical protein
VIGCRAQPLCCGGKRGRCRLDEEEYGVARQIRKHGDVTRLQRELSIERPGRADAGRKWR